MPEGPEVYTTAKFLNRRFKGKTLIGMNHHTEKCLYGDISDVEQATILRIRSRGKKIIFDLSTGHYIMVALMMEGKLHLQPANKHLHITFNFSDGSALYYCETRPFGGVYYCHYPEELEACLASVGPDLIQDKVTEDQWMKKWRSLRSTQSIAQLLLEQKIFAGIGNYLRADILYHAQIHPLATLSTLTNEELSILYHSTMKIIMRAVRKNGYSLASYTLPDGTHGEYESLIYGHDTDVDGNPVEKMKLGGRTVHWVPDVQTYGR